MKSLCVGFFALILVCLMAPQPGISQEKRPPRPTRGQASTPQVRSASLGVVSDLPQRLAKYKPVRMPFNAAGLSERQKRMVNELVNACQDLEDIYWRQSDPEGLTLYQQLAGSGSRRDQEVRQFLWINGSRFDLLENNQPFVGNGPYYPGHGFYPEGVTREQVEQYVKEHPDAKDEIYNPFTIVRWQGKELEAIPYHIAYRSFLLPMTKALRAAAALSDDAAFANFLRLRADSLLTDDYYKSDLAWMDLKEPKFDVIFAPYETYLDDLLGVKTSYGAAVLIRNEAESKKLAVFEKYVPEIQDSLPLAAEDRPSLAGKQTPLEVMDAPFRAGDLTHGYQAVADNLPNDPRMHAEKGTKKIFFKNFMDARVDYVILPLAKRVMKPEQAARASAEGYLFSTIMHEISHGLGPAYARTAAGQVDIREAIGPLYGALEEAKADVVGMYGLKWLVDKGVLPQSRLEEYYDSYVAGIFRSVRYGTAEAHGRAEMMEFNFLSSQNAIQRDSSGRYEVDYAKMPAAIEAMSKELLEIEATGDRARAERWFARYDKMPPELSAALAKNSDIPVDVSPIFSFPYKLE